MFWRFIFSGTKILSARVAGLAFWQPRGAGEGHCFIYRCPSSWHGDPIDFGYPTSRVRMPAPSTLFLVSSWQIYVLAAGLLAVLSLLHIASSALGRRDPCQLNGPDSVGESLLNSRQENYDRFEEVLVSIFGGRTIPQEIRKLILTRIS